MRTSTTGRVGQYAALLAYLVFLAFPFLWLLSTAFKSPRELGSLHPTWIPRDPTLDNFRQAFDEQPLLRAAGNSLLAALAAAVIAVLIATPSPTSWPATAPGSRRPPPAGWWSARPSRSSW